VVVAGECIDGWVHERIDRVERARGAALQGPFERLRRELDAALRGRSVRAGTVHGDLWLGNMLMAPDASRVTGVVDWEHASAHGPVGADLAHLVLSTRSLASGQELGAVTCRLVEGREQLSELERDLLSGWGIAPRELLLLAWLQHLTGRMSQSTLHLRARWLRRNADPVLKALR
jgi:aminoglycoside phosphotransferase (APT) family kinase protein